MHTLQELIMEAQAYAGQWSWSAGRPSFLSGLRDGTLAPALLRGYLRELVSFRERYEEFGSAILHFNVQPDVMFTLSAKFVQVAKLDPEPLKRPDDALLPLPATEALCNLLLILAETDPHSYLVATSLLPEHVLGTNELKAAMSLMEWEAGEAEVLAKFLDILGTSPSMVERIQSYFPPVSEADRIRIMNNVHLLLETTDLLFGELITGYPRWSRESGSVHA